MCTRLAAAAWRAQCCFQGHLSHLCSFPAHPLHQPLAEGLLYLGPHFPFSDMVSLLCAEQMGNGGMWELFHLLPKRETAPKFVPMLQLVTSWQTEVAAGSGRDY